MAAAKKEEKKPIKTGASSGHITNLKQSILETFDIFATHSGLIFYKTTYKFLTIIFPPGVSYLKSDDDILSDSFVLNAPLP